jgi:hypothetical protein
VQPIKLHLAETKKHASNHHRRIVTSLLSVNTVDIIAEVLLAAINCLTTQTFKKYNAFIKSDL